MSMRTTRAILAGNAVMWTHSLYFGSIAYRVSSLKVDCGHCSVIVYEDRKYNGDYKAFMGDVPNVRNWWKDRIFSLQIRPWKLPNLEKRTCVILYEHRDYRGRSRRDCDDVVSLYPDWNDKVSSLKMTCKDCSVILFQDRTYRVNYKAFMEDVSYVGKWWNDRASSIQIKHFPLSGVEENCIDQREQKVYNVIQHIPFLSLLYGLGSSFGYGVKGCNSLAKERAIDMGIGFGTDAAVALTGGAAGAGLKAGALGIRVGMKLGVKSGMKTFGQALKSTIKNTVKNAGRIASRGVTGNVKAIGKSVVQETKNILTTIRTVAKALKTGAKKMPKALMKTPRKLKDSVKRIRSGAAKVQNDGIVQVLRKSGEKTTNKIKKAAKRKYNDLADSAQRQIDLDKNIAYSRLCRRIKRSPDRCLPETQGHRTSHTRKRKKKKKKGENDRWEKVTWKAKQRPRQRSPVKTLSGFLTSDHLPRIIH